MQRAELLKLAESVLRLPTAPYHEHAVRAFVIEHCRALGLRVERDRAGNVIVKYVGAPFRARVGRSRPEGRSHKSPPLVLMAHMDHPGFEALGGKRAEFLGGVHKIANRITVGLVIAALLVASSLMMRVPATWRIFGYPALFRFILSNRLAPIKTDPARRY